MCLMSKAIYSRINRTEELLELVDSLRDVNDLQSLQSTYFEHISRLIQADAYGFYLLDKELCPQKVYTVHAPTDFLSMYEQQGRHVDPVLSYVVANGRSIHECALSDSVDWVHEPMGRIMRAWNFYHLLEGPLIWGKTVIGTLNFARRLHSQPFNELDLITLNFICRQISAICGRFLELTSSVTKLELFQKSAELLHLPIIITQGSQKILFANRYAQVHIFGTCSNVTLDSMKEYRYIHEILKKNINHLETSHGRAAEHFVCVGIDSPQYFLQTYLFDSADNTYLSVLTYPYLRARTEFNLIGFKTLLSQREREILIFLTNGWTNKAIARQLYISENTVKFHVKNIYMKLGINSRVELYRCIQLGTPLNLHENDF